MGLPVSYLMVFIIRYLRTDILSILLKVRLDLLIFQLFLHLSQWLLIQNSYNNTTSISKITRIDGHSQSNTMKNNQSNNKKIKHDSLIILFKCNLVDLNTLYFGLLSNLHDNSNSHIIRILPISIILAISSYCSLLQTSFDYPNIPLAHPHDQILIFHLLFLIQTYQSTMPEYNQYLCLAT